ncbi:MAG: EAL domain-containing protein [Thauera sp.]|nr:EAL domain-containing protein [Thauera sp.]
MPFRQPNAAAVSVPQPELEEMRRVDLQIRGAGLGTWAWNVQTGEIRINEDWARIVGCTKAELEPTTIETWEAFVHPDDLAESNRRLEEHFRGETERYECECRMRHRDGHWVWVLDQGQVLTRDAEGRPLWMFGVHTDLSRHKAVEQERDALLERFRRLVQHLPGYLYQYRLRPDGSSHFPFATDAIELVYGCSAQDVLEDATPVFDAIHPEDRERVARAICESAESLGIWKDHYRICHPTRGVIWIEGLATPERLADGSTLWHGFLMDVTDAERQRAKLRLTERVFSSTQEGIIVTDLEGRIVEVNDAFARVTGYEAHEVIGQRVSVLKSGKQGREFYRQLWNDLRTRGRWQGEIWNRRKSGELYPEWLSIDSVLDEHGTLEHYVGVFSDMTLIKQHEEQLDRATYYDALTGLPNRRLVADRLQLALAHAKRNREIVAVCYLDVDRFKEVNELHDAGVADRILAGLADRLLHALRAGDTVGRVGGDEFLILLTELRSCDEALDLVRRILAIVRTPHVLGPQGTIELTASIGVAMYPDIDVSADELIRYADQALFRAKERGRNGFVVFDREEDVTSRVRADLLQAALGALTNGEFRLYYQPKLDLRSGRIWSVEALIRWRLPGGRIRPPGEFIEALAGTTLEAEVGNWVVDEALRQQRVWHEHGLSMPVSINVSADHLLGDGFLSMLGDALSRHWVDRRPIVALEILETSRISDFNRLCQRLLECKALGVLFSLDDFGTGYSSMTYMRQLPVDALKIDRSFVQTMLESEADLSIVKGIIGLGRAFDRMVIAEGVETEAHIERLKELGCDIAQGYRIARPMPADELMPWVAAWNGKLG